jgi:hypothetical protein
MTRRVAVLALTAACVWATGCIDVEQTLTLERNMSGRAGFAMKFNLEPLVTFMAQMTREMEGKTGPPTAEEIEKVKAEFQKDTVREGRDNFDSERKDFESKLPNGVKLLDASFQEEGLKIGANFMFGFENFSQLSQISFPKKAAEGPGGPPGNPIENPFEDLKLVDEGATILITGPVENPMSDEQEKMPPDPELRKQVEALMTGLRVAFKITSPLTVVESTAHRREGNTLVWEYDLKSIEKLTPEQLKQGIRVRYRK